MFVLNMLAANASKQKTKTTSFKSQRRKALSRRASPQKACWPISSSAISIRDATLPPRIPVYPVGYRTSRTPWQGGLSKSVRVRSTLRGLKTHLLEQVVIQADETPLNVLKEDKQCYMWLYCSGADSPEAASLM
ncbi:IS66 family transposase [Vibrio anguillarum]|uniref:IS66 family transposase n=1 Tax=Vibrio anguillarum TaxID=55601 RepID=UPI0039C35C89